LVSFFLVSVVPGIVVVADFFLLAIVDFPFKN